LTKHIRTHTGKNRSFVLNRGAEKRLHAVLACERTILRCTSTNSLE
jgi:hypothetical protein